MPERTTSTISASCALMDVISLEGLVLAAGGVENDAEIGAVMKDVVPVLAGYRRFHSWAILMRAMGHNDGGLLRALTDMHRDLKRGVSDFFRAVRESGIEFDDSVLITALQSLAPVS
ncbi:MAG: hypothetical protein M3475_08890 [Actinomycetota bacterium]|nr:hypothetical protein [Actinomycetota bacterium]